MIHVSNFVHPAGRAASPFYLGTSQLTTSYHTKNLGITTFIIGAILVMGVYELFIYFFRRGERAFFYFGLITILISFYSFMMPPEYLYVFDFYPVSFVVAFGLLQRNTLSIVYHWYKSMCACYSTDLCDGSELIDRALYQSKKNGKNRVTFL